MKLLTHLYLLGSVVVPTSFGFLIPNHSNHGVANKITGLTKIGAAEIAVDNSEGKAEGVDEYSRFGVSKESIAVGVDVNDLLQWVGKYVRNISINSLSN